VGYYENGDVPSALYLTFWKKAEVLNLDMRDNEGKKIEEYFIIAS
jgi:hypothetical protein